MENDSNVPNLKIFLNVIFAWVLIIGGITYNAGLYYQKLENQEIKTSNAQQQAQALQILEKIRDAINSQALINGLDEKSQSLSKPRQLPIGKLTGQKKSSTAGSIPSITPPAPKTISVPVPVQTPKFNTPNDFLDNTKLALNQRTDGTYWIQFVTGTYKWDPVSKSVGGVNNIPRYESLFGCNPTYDKSDDPLVSVASFKTNSSYSCDVTLRSDKGVVGRKNFSFTTGHGFMTIARGTGMLDSSVLKEGTNMTGLVFNNNDDYPATVSGVKIDLSFVGLDPTKPASIRFADGDGNRLKDYFFADVVNGLLTSNKGSISDLELPVSFNVPAHGGKLIYVEGLGIRRMGLYEKPALSVTIKQIITNNSVVIKSSSLPITVQWSCNPGEIGIDPLKFAMDPESCKF